MEWRGGCCCDSRQIFVLDEVIYSLGCGRIFVVNMKVEEKSSWEEIVMFEAIHHIAIIGSDYNATRCFYVDTLGFKVVREHYRSEKDDYKIDLVCGEQEIELFIVKNAPSRPSYPEACGLRHLAFRVDSVDEMVKVLNAKGIETEPVRIDDYTQKKMTFFRDPDGLPLEIHE